MDGFDCGGSVMLDAGGGTIDASRGVVPEAGSSGRSDAGPVVIDPGNPLAGLAGSYLMRVDYYSTAMGMSAGSSLNLKTRVSNLFHVTLSPGGTSTLNATEKFCDQVSAHQCEVGCSNWQTLYSSSRFAKINGMAPLTRSYQIDASGNMNVGAAGALLRVGYDDAQDSTAPIPANYTDARVWQLSTAVERQRGMATALKGTLIAMGLQLVLNCEVDTVQLYATAFKAALGTNLSQSQLATRIMQVTTAGSGGNVIVAVGDPGQVCNVPSLQTTSDSGEKAFVRFLPTDQAGCPTDGPTFENLFPLPQEANLDPPTPTDP